MLGRLREEEFLYTLSPPLLGEDSVDEFLFGTRRGFCEHYAGSFAFVMRAAGIPARVVLGYQGGERNPVGGYLIVRQSDAHAWVELHLPEVGWVRIDPTAAVAPDRIERGLAALEGLEGRPLRPMRDFRWLNQVRLRWDDLNNRWNLFVLGYDQDRQLELLARLGFRDADWRTLVTVMMVLLIVIMTLLAAWLVWQLRPRRLRDPAVRLFERLQRILSRRGCPPRWPGEGPRDYAARVGGIDGFMEAYLRYRYGPHPSADDLRRMKDALKES